MNALPWYKSPVYIGLVVNLVAGLVNVLNLQEVVTLEFINNTVAVFFTLAGIVTAVIGEFKRRKSTIQPLTLTQAGANRQSGQVRVALLALMASVLTVGTLAAGCVSNPIKAAETAEQKAYALYGSFVIYEEQAAKLVQLAETPAGVKTALRQADAVAKPIADRLLLATLEVIRIKKEVEAGGSTSESLVIALGNLDRYITELGPKLKDLQLAVKEAT